MTELIVDAAARTMSAFGESFPCAIGWGGLRVAADKRESDGSTPIGRWPLRGVLLRRQRVRPPPALPWRWLRSDDGWCDEPGDPAYNRCVRLPYPASAEALWRSDDAYDAIVVLGHNDAPPSPGAGSAIFLHVMPASGVTAGCVALNYNDLLRLLPRLAPGDVLVVMDPAADQP